MNKEIDVKNTAVKCPACGRENSFNQPYAYHAGFSDQGFLYNDEGNLTFVWSAYDPAYAAIVGKNNPYALTEDQKKEIEDVLLPAPKGGNWRFSNPARCLFCKSPISAPIGESIYYLLYEGSICTSANPLKGLGFGNYLIPSDTAFS